MDPSGLGMGYRRLKRRATASSKVDENFYVKAVKRGG